MAPKPPDQKRKRGRPPGASRPTENASSRKRPADNDDDAEEASRPRKRGRKAFEDKTAANAENRERDEPAQPGRRGRPAKRKAQIQAAEVVSPAEIQQKTAKQKPGGTSSSKSRLAGSKARAPEAQVDEEPPSSGTRRSGRERRSYNPEEMYSARRANHSPTQFTSPPSDSSRMPPPPRRTKKPEQPGSTPRRSGRERRDWDAEKLFSASRQRGEQQEASSSSAPRVTEKAKGKKGPLVSQEDAPGPKTQKKATARSTAPEAERPSRMLSNERPVDGPSRSTSGKKTHALKEAAADAAQPRRRGRPKQSKPTPQNPEPSQPSRSRKRSPQARDEQAPARSKHKPPQRRRAALDEEDDSESEEQDDAVPFRHLQEITRNIQRSTISDKWTPLDPSSINAVSTFLIDAQRPVLLRLQNTSQRRGHASSALGVVIRRLRSKLVKGFPFPAPTAGASTRGNASTYEADFDFERTVDAMQTLENTLNPLLHSVSLLEREIRQEEDALARDYDSLHHLETNAKAEAREWRDKTRREHVLAPGLKTKDEQDIEPQDRWELVPTAEDGVMSGLFKDLEDEELVTLSKQIGSHMESMKGNLQPIDGVLPAITKSKAALQQVLLKHLDDEQYENVLLG